MAGLTCNIINGFLSVCFGETTLRSLASSTCGCHILVAFYPNATYKKIKTMLQMWAWSPHCAVSSNARQATIVELNKLLTTFELFAFFCGLKSQFTKGPQILVSLKISRYTVSSDKYIVQLERIKNKQSALFWQVENKLFTLTIVVKNNIQQYITTGRYSALYFYETEFKVE